LSEHHRLIALFQLANSYLFLNGPSRSKVMDDWGGEHQPNASKWLPAMNPSLKEVRDPRLS
jgi:hypothetical protein